MKADSPTSTKRTSTDRLLKWAGYQLACFRCGGRLQFFGRMLGATLHTRCHRCGAHRVVSNPLRPSAARVLAG